MIAIIDYGMGNLFSVKNALDFIGVPSEITREPASLARADGMILPGVGAFPAAMRELSRSGLTQPIREQAKKKPLLGICLGMQMLFERGYEFEECEGLGLIDGEIRLLKTGGLKIPHIGWNALSFQNPCPLLDGVDEGAYVYFVHSFVAHTRDENIAAYTVYGEKVPALVCKGNVFGAQFHPEKSSSEGLAMLKNFSLLTRKTSEIRA
jgi:glutamine amidotransferase